MFFTEIYLTDPRNIEADNPCIHRCPYEIRTGFHYSPKPEQDIVFVINEKVTLPEVNFIQQTCDIFGLKNNFYDISMHGTLDLFKPLPHLTTCLAEDLKGKTLAIINNDFLITSTAQNTLTAWTIEFLEKQQVIRAVGEFDVRFVVFSPQQHNFVSWGLRKCIEEPPRFNDTDEFIKAEYDFQEKIAMVEKIGSSCIIGVNKSALSFKTNQEKVINSASEVVQVIKKRFPSMNYVGVPLMQEVQGTKKIGEIHMYRTIPVLTQNLTFMDFNTIQARHVDFCVGFLISVDITKRAKALLKLSQDEISPKKDLIFALQESIMFTLCREIRLGTLSKHSTKFFFDNFTALVDTFMQVLGEEKEWTVKNLEEFILRIKNYAKRQFKAKDVLLFWVAHAKLNKQLNKKLDKLLAMMSKDNKEMRAKRDVTAKLIESDYQARKKKYPAELPKYLFATRLDLDQSTYRNLVQVRDLIKPEELKDFFDREQIHGTKRLQLMDIKR